MARGGARVACLALAAACGAPPSEQGAASAHRPTTAAPPASVVASAPALALTPQHEPSAAIPSGVPPIQACAPIEARATGERKFAPIGTTLLFGRGALAVCVDSAMYPYAPGRGHGLVTQLSVRVGAEKEETFRVEGEGELSVGDWIVKVGLDKARHSAAPDVWIEVRRKPSGDPL